VFATPGNGITINGVAADAWVQGISLDIDLIAASRARQCPISKPFFP
jgi:hypothetical protein